MEIGSEFWLENSENQNINKYFWEIGKDNKFLLSGRTAIDYILQDILNKKQVNNVYFPSYCCNSMIEPFRKRNINIKFYNIYFDDGLNYEIDCNIKCDIFFAMNYFGYTSTNMEKYIEEFKNNGSIIIEDITHSLLSKKRYCNKSDYLIASLRKWFPIISGGLAVNLKNNFSIDTTTFKENTKMCTIKEEAMIEKAKYINFEEKQSCIEFKEKFLEKYKKSNKILENDYQNYLMDKKSKNILFNLNIDEIIKMRKQNVQIIYSMLKNIKNIDFFVDKLSDEDCLLFVPIVLNQHIKEELKKYLIQNKIYCPTHWEIDDKINTIYINEISLICDQRYNKQQIKEYIEKIIKFLESKNGR